MIRRDRALCALRDAVQGPPKDPLTALIEPANRLLTSMDIQIATICDFASDYNGKLVISGTFDTLAARSLPVVHPACALAMRFCFTQEDTGRHKFFINIINEDGESLDPNNMPIEPEFEVQLPNNLPFITRNMVMNLQGLRFQEAGIYSIDIGCDGEVLVRLPLRIVLVDPQGDKKA
jgi:hypothetical protein